MSSANPVPEGPGNPSNVGKPLKPLRGPRRFADASTGFSGWVQDIPGNREVVTPCVDGDRLFVGGGFGSHEFYAFDTRTGESLWQRHTGDDGPTAAVAGGGAVAFNTESCTVLVLDVATGEKIWERRLGDPLLAQPAVGDGRLFMAWPTRNRENRLGAFNLANGRLLWVAALPADVITAPVYAGGRLYAATFDGSVHQIDPRSGTIHWTKELGATSAPWVHGGEVFVAHRDAEAEAEAARAARAGRAGAHPGERYERVGSLRAGFYTGRTRGLSAEYLRSKRGTAGESLDRRRDAGVGFGTAPAAAKLDYAERLLGATSVYRTWRHQGSRPCVADGCIYSVVGEVLTATSLATGDEIWRWSGRIDGCGERALTPPAVANGRIYCGSRDGKVLSWDAASGRLRWSVEVGASAHWQPVVSKGWVHVGADSGRLVSFATGDPADDGWPMWGGGAGHNGSHP